jgi:hypothetical protein
MVYMDSSVNETHDANVQSCGELYLPLIQHLTKLIRAYTRMILLCASLGNDVPKGKSRLTQDQQQNLQGTYRCNFYNENSSCGEAETISTS